MSARAPRSKKRQQALSGLAATIGNDGKACLPKQSAFVPAALRTPFWQPGGLAAPFARPTQHGCGAGHAHKGCPQTANSPTMHETSNRKSLTPPEVYRDTSNHLPRASGRNGKERGNLWSLWGGAQAVRTRPPDRPPCDWATARPNVRKAKPTPCTTYNCNSAWQSTSRGAPTHALGALCNSMACGPSEPSALATCVWQ